MDHAGITVQSRMLYDQSINILTNNDFYKIFGKFEIEEIIYNSAPGFPRKS